MAKRYVVLMVLRVDLMEPVSWVMSVNGEWGLR